MIQRLLTEIVSKLRDGFNGEFSNPNPDPEDHIVLGNTVPNNNDMPFIAVHQGVLTVNTQVRDTLSSEVRPQRIVEEKIINSENPDTIYSLNQIPLEGSVLCRVIYDLGERTERQQLLVLGTDYTVDAPNQSILFSFSLSGASVIRLTYSYAGVFTIREFQQVFFVDVYTDPFEEAERWAALSSTIILTHYNELLEAAHEYQESVSPYVAQRSINQLLWTASEQDRTVSPERIRLSFQVQGQFAAIKEIPGDFGIIEKVRSPGVGDAGFPVDIEPQL